MEPNVVGVVSCRLQNASQLLFNTPVHIAGIIIQTLTPGATRTSLLGVMFPHETEAHLKMISVPVDNFISYAINTIGWADTCDGHPFHCLTGHLLSAGNHY